MLCLLNSLGIDNYFGFEIELERGFPKPIIIHLLLHHHFEGPHRHFRTAENNSIMEMNGPKSMLLEYPLSSFHLLPEN